MKKIALALVGSLALATAAHADASFCLSATPAGAPKQEACWSISDAALVDLVMANTARFFPNGKDSGDGTFRPATPAEVLAVMGEVTKEEILSQVTAYKRAQAAATVAPITATPQ